MIRGSEGGSGTSGASTGSGHAPAGVWQRWVECEVGDRGGPPGAWDRAVTYCILAVAVLSAAALLVLTRCSGASADF